MANPRLERLKNLQTATKEYVEAERKRLKNETDSLQSILNGRTAGKGIQRISTTVVAAAAYKDLDSYLKER